MLLQYHHIFLKSSYSTIKIIICDIEKLLQCHPIFAMALQHYAKILWHIPCLLVRLWATFELNCKLELTFSISKCQCECFYYLNIWFCVKANGFQHKRGIYQLFVTDKIQFSLLKKDNSFQYLNNITHIFIHFFTHTYFQKIQITLLEQHYQTLPKILQFYNL